MSALTAWDGTSISIHSLVKRETAGNVTADTSTTDISIHSLVKRETDCLSDKICKIIRHFNPLPRKEGDRKYS